MDHIDRRTALGYLAAAGAFALTATPGLARSDALLRKPIPGTGETIPAIGLGSWQTFNVGDDPRALDRCAEVIGRFFALGGTVIDSSPMYGSSQPTIGHAIAKLGKERAVFSADKVWTSSGNEGPEQIEQSRRHWQVPYFHLLQIHNLLSWEDHLRTLQRMKQERRVRYIGITTSHGRRHDEFERVIRNHDLDFIQVTYNAVDREVEQRILPLARERGMAVLVNRPFRQGDLIDKAKRHPLPPWAGEAGCANWAQLLLKFIVSHPAVTCAIPATGRIDHLEENMGAMTGLQPDEPMRRRIAAHVEGL
ncbi:MAG: aldo/keto reductase [Sphingomonadales bacterium]